MFHHGYKDPVSQLPLKLRANCFMKKAELLYAYSGKLTMLRSRIIPSTTDESVVTNFLLGLQDRAIISYLRQFCRSKSLRSSPTACVSWNTSSGFDQCLFNFYQYTTSTMSLAVSIACQITGAC